MATRSQIVTAALRRIRNTDDRTAMYVNGEDEFTLRNVVIGERKYRYDDQDGFSVYQETRDFIVESAQMKGLEPKVGHLIREEFDQFNHTFKVVSLNGEKPWHYCDDKGSAIRIHTILQSREPIQP